MSVLIEFWNKGDIIDCRPRFSFSFLCCDFYHFWIFSYTNWLQVWLGVGYKYKIKNISLWNDDICYIRNIIGNNLSAHFHWKQFAWNSSIPIIYWILDKPNHLLGFSNTIFHYFVLYISRVDFVNVETMSSKKYKRCWVELYETQLMNFLLKISNLKSDLTSRYCFLTSHLSYLSFNSKIISRKSILWVI